MNLDLPCPNAYSLVLRSFDASGTCGVAQGSFGKDSVQFKNPPGRERVTRELGDLAHSAVVVEDHSFGLSPRVSSSAQELHGDPPGRRSAFKLTRCDRFFNERSNNELIAAARGHGSAAPGYGASGSASDLLGELQNFVGHREGEGRSVLCSQRHRSHLGTALELEPKPPLIMSEAVWRSPADQLLPVEVADYVSLI